MGNIEFANFTATTEDKKVLKDFFVSIIIPAFTGDYIRESRFKTSYLFTDVKVSVITRNNKEDVSISGRIVKNMLLERDQIFLDGKLVEDHQSMQSSPSSIFVLLLSDHKLVYLKETPGAPGILAFQNTLQKFVRFSRSAYISRLTKDFKSGIKLDPEFIDKNTGKATKKFLFEKIKLPIIDIIPLPSSQSLRNFLNSFESINSIETRIISTNHEVSFSDLISSIEQDKKELRADNAVLRYSSKEGLDKTKAKEQIKEIADQGNAQLKIEGTGKQGEKITGNNESFKVSIHIDDIGNADPSVLVPQLTKQYDDLVGSGTLSPSGSAIPIEEMKRIILNLSLVFQIIRI